MFDFEQERIHGNVAVAVAASSFVELASVAADRVCAALATSRT